MDTQRVEQGVASLKNYAQKFVDAAQQISPENRDNLSGLVESFLNYGPAIAASEGEEQEAFRLNALELLKKIGELFVSSFDVTQESGKFLNSIYHGDAEPIYCRLKSGKTIAIRKGKHGVSVTTVQVMDLT